MRSYRRLMDPCSLEMLVMLRFNRNLWDERDVDIVMTRNYGSEVAASGTPLTPSSALHSPMTYAIESSNSSSR